MAALPDTDQGSGLLAIDQIGQRLGCSRRTVFRLLSERAFPSIKVGRQRLAAAEDVDDYLRALRESSR
jgi:excisionase family DNA binding protein